jgi:hypothetical protein
MPNKGVEKTLRKLGVSIYFSAVEKTKENGFLRNPEESGGIRLIPVEST